MGLLSKGIELREARFRSFDAGEDGLLRHAILFNAAGRRGGVGVLAYIEKKKP